MLANWLRQRILTGTSGDIDLGDPVEGFIGCSSVFTNDGKVHYSVEDSHNRETGIGTYKQATNSIVRDTAFETLIGGTYNNSPSVPMTLTNDAIVSITATVRGLTTHVPVWKDIVGAFTQNDGTGYLSPDVKPLAGGVEVFTFGSTLEEALSVRFALPHDIAVGSQMYPHIRWSPNSSDTGTIRWGIEFMVAELDTGIFKDATTIYLEDAGLGTLNKLQVVNAATQITAANPNTVIIGRIFRDATHANDTFTGEASLHVVGMHYQSDALGTPSKDTALYTWG
jgi:hypothetical protein